MRRAASPINLEHFGDLLTPEQAMEPILARPVRAALLEWLTEIWAADELEEAGLKPRQRALFFGPPGTGKTTLAHHLAARLGLPMLSVQSETIVDTWLGSTGKNIGSLFAAAKEDGPVVLFLDEFDALAPTRQAGARDAQQERNAAVNTLLQRIEAHEGPIIAATNFAKDIDPAIWRRFDIQVELLLPGPDEVRRIVARYLAPFGQPAATLDALTAAMETASPALMRQFCEALKRAQILGPKLGWDMRREAVIDRIVQALQPHKSLGKPRMWSLGSKDPAVARIVWPMPLAGDVPTEVPAPPEATPSTNVYQLGKVTP